MLLNKDELNIFLKYDWKFIDFIRLTDSGIECIAFITSKEGFEKFFKENENKDKRMWAIRTSDRTALIIVE